MTIPTKSHIRIPKPDPAPKPKFKVHANTKYSLLVLAPKA